MNKMNYGCEGLCVVITAVRQASAWQRHSAFWQTVRVYIFWDVLRSVVRRHCIIWRSRQGSRQCIFPVM